MQFRDDWKVSREAKIVEVTEGCDPEVVQHRLRSFSSMLNPSSYPPVVLGLQLSLSLYCIVFNGFQVSGVK